MKDLTVKQQKELEDDGKPASVPVAETVSPSLARKEAKERDVKKLCLKLTKLLLPFFVVLLLVVLALVEAKRQLEDLLNDHTSLSDEKTELLNQINQIQMNLEDLRMEYTTLSGEKEDIEDELRTLQVAKNKSCADGWEYFSGRCYYFSHDYLNWTASRDSCVTLGGHLAIIETEEEQEDQPDEEDDAVDAENEEDCVVMTWTSKDWDDVLCTGQYKRICESKAAD
ncbi:hypothetical protein ACEWY4_024980 [Coilia grayii]|uniref:C-type lectin domain-containing protein n=1 Tax=Coilia grayii TaxID=363190 RepID=A0ABD1IZC0_9TELE